MSISAKPWDSAGGGASVPDASETTKGIIEIATSAEATTGTDDLKAMTPLTVKERIDAALVGGVEYKGTWNATTGLPTLINAVTGDLYKVDTLGTIYGKVWAVGDQLIINDDMGGSITNSKIDKIDNTEAVTSVNALTGAVLLSMDNIHDVISGASSSGDLLMYDGSDWNNTAKSSIAVSAFNDDNTYLAVSDNLSDLNNAGTARTNLGLGTASTKDTGVANGNVIVADATGLPVIDGSQLTGITATDATKLAIANNLSDLNNVGTARTNLGLGTASVKDTGVANGNVIVADATGLPVIDGSQLTGVTGTDATKLAIANNLSDLNSASTARTNLGLGTASVKDTGVANGNVIVADATGLPVIDGSQLTGITATDATKLAIANNLSDLNNVGTARTNLGLGTASTSASTDFLAVSNNLSDLNNAGTARTNLGLVIGTDVSAIASPAFTGSPTAPTQSASDNSTKVATTAYVDAAVVAGGGLSSVVQDTSPELGGNLDVLARSIVSSSNRAITLTPDGSGLVEISGNATSGSGQIKLNCEQNTHGIRLKSPPHSATADYTLVFPDDLGTSGKVLTTNGGGGGGSTIGTLTWETVSTTDTTKLAILNNLSDLDNAGTARTNLGLVIGTNVQAYDPGLTSIAGLTTAADKMIFTDGSDSYAVTGLTSAGRALLDDADASAQRTTLGLVIGTDVAPIAAPAFTGNATAVTQSQSDGSTKIATTAYVDTAVAGASGGGYTYSAKTASFTAAADYHYSCTNAITATLPAASSNANKAIRIKVMGADTVTIGRNGSDKIDGVASDYSMTIQYSSITLFSNGSDGWEII